MEFGAKRKLAKSVESSGHLSSVRLQGLSTSRSLRLHLFLPEGCFYSGLEEICSDGELNLALVFYIASCSSDGCSAVLNPVF